MNVSDASIFSDYLLKKIKIELSWMQDKVDGKQEKSASVFQADMLLDRCISLASTRRSVNSFKWSPLTDKYHQGIYE